MVKKVGIVILIHNSKKWINFCLETLFKTEYNFCSIIVFDNASTDLSIKEKKFLFKDVTYMYSKENLGWGNANNIAAKKLIKQGIDYIIFLNSDTAICDFQWIKKLVKFANTHKDYMVLGPLQLNYYDDDYNNWTKYIIDNGNKDVLHMWKSKYFYVEKKEKPLKVTNVFFVQGSAMFVRKEAFEKIGFFDPMYYIYYDEVDFCRRLRCLGYKIALLKDCFIRHYGGGDTAKKHKLDYQYLRYFTESKIKYVMTDTITGMTDRKNILKRMLLNDIKTLKRDDLFAVIDGIVDVIASYDQLFKRLKKKGE